MSILRITPQVIGAALLATATGVAALPPSAGGVLDTAAPVLAQADNGTEMGDRDRMMDQDRLRDQDRVYGSQMMTPQERAAYRQRMGEANGAQERERIRAEHHERMRERARDTGMEMPGDPPARGMGNGPGDGMGRGSGGYGGGRR